MNHSLWKNNNTKLFKIINLSKRKKIYTHTHTYRTSHILKSWSWPDVCGIFRVFILYVNNSSWMCVLWVAVGVWERPWFRMTHWGMPEDEYSMYTHMQQHFWQEANTWFSEIFPCLQFTLTIDMTGIHLLNKTLKQMYTIWGADQRKQICIKEMIAHSLANIYFTTISATSLCRGVISPIMERSINKQLITGVDNQLAILNF